MASNLDDRACPRFLDGFHKNILPWDRFNRWITCFCVVTFDLELGQAMELIYPRFVRLSEKEKMSICYSAFPDSNSGCMGDTQFHFRMRSESGSCKSKSCCRSNENGLPFGYKSDFGHYYGFVYFRQVKDPSIPRGYFQKSLVLITRLPYVNFFSAVVKLVAPGYFDVLELALEASCNDIDHWPYPAPGQTLSLPIMGYLIQVHLPSGKDKPGTILSPSSSLENTNAIQAPPIQISIPLLKETDMYRCISPVLNSIHLLWELVLLNEPIVVMAPSPSLCSDVVQTLITLIHPLHFNSDFRPFFTIHDSEFKEYTTKTHSPPPVIIGVTNPFFAKTLQHWPHILRIGAMNDLVIGGRPSPLGNEKRSFEAKPGIYTRYKQYLQRDKLFIKAIKRGGQKKRPAEAQNAILRKHMRELTQSFIIPLERYAASLMPLQRSISPWKLPPKLKSFDAEEFLKTVEHSGPQLTTGLKGDWKGLYRRFFRSANFEGWFRNRQHQIQQKLLLLHLEALAVADMSSWMTAKNEVEIVDFILKTREKMKSARHFETQVTDDVLKKLCLQMEQVLDTLPQDLQHILRKG